MRGATREEELEAFKTQIDLREYMASRGYTLDPKKSSRSYSVMRHANGDKCIVTRKANRHWIYANAHDSRDQGTIICFVQHRERCSIGEVRKELRPWIGRTGSVVAGRGQTFAELSPSEHDATQVIGIWEEAHPIKQFHDYLQTARKVPGRVISDPIFAGRIRTDRRQNALFVHYNSSGISGFEIKNHRFTGFATGGVKGLFCSRPRPEDQELVICETAIDALSYAALFGSSGKRFLSTAGQISPTQRALLQSAAEKLSPGGSIVLAMDNDQGGRQLIQTITETLAQVDFTEKNIVPRMPSIAGEDWNDVLRRTIRPKFAFPTPE